METQFSNDLVVTKSPKVSVLVPVYRTDPTFLREAIRSILTQTYADFELVILDDCPDDPRESVVREFDDARIRYARNTRNLGITPSRNRLVDMARGDYLAVFDHDDISHPTRLEKEVVYLDAHPECGVVSSWTRVIPSGEIIRHKEDDRAIRLGLMGGCCIAHSAAMIRASVLKETGIRYEESFSPAEDYAIFLKLVPHVRFHNIPEPLLDYRWHGDNTSATQAAKMTVAGDLAHRWAERNFPELYDEFLARTPLVSRVRLFGIPGLLKIVSTAQWTKVYVFSFLPLIIIQRRHRR